MWGGSEEQAKDKHVVRQTGARIISIAGRLRLNERNGVAVKNIESQADKETSVKFAEDNAKSSAAIESASRAEHWQL